MNHWEIVGRIAAEQHAQRAREAQRAALASEVGRRSTRPVVRATGVRRLAVAVALALTRRGRPAGGGATVVSSPSKRQMGGDIRRPGDSLRDPRGP